MNKIIPFLILIFTVILAKSQQKFPVVNFTPREYGEKFEAQNNAVVQDTFGFLYFGNSNGILQYDGAEWRFITVAKGTWITALALSGNNTIYVGTSGKEFGFLKADKKGLLKYESLTSLLNEELRNEINWIRRIVADTDQIIFQTDKLLLILKNQHFNIIKPIRNSFQKCYISDHRIFVRERNTGLLELISGNQLNLIENEMSASAGISDIIVDTAHQIHIFTSENGILNLIPDRNQFRVQNLKADIQKWLISSKIIGAVQLHDRNIAVNTLNNGLAVISPEGELLYKINKENSGILNNTVTQLFQDKNQNIWCVADNGISMIDYSSPISLFSEETGLSGKVYSIDEFRGSIYIGTTEGLFTYDERGGRYKKLFIHDAVYNMTNGGKELFIATNQAIYSFNGISMHTLFQGNCQSLCYEDSNNRLFAACSNDLLVFKNNRII